MANRVKIKGVVKTAPSASNGRQVVKPKLRNGSRGVLTEKILITVKNKDKDKSDKGKEGSEKKQ